MADWCDGCGLCCMTMRTPPFSDPAEFVALPVALQQELDAWAGTEDREPSPRFRLSKYDSPCLWLDLVTGKCRHYEHRPEVCREYEVGNQSCRTMRREVGLTVKGMPVVTE